MAEGLGTRAIARAGSRIRGARGVTEVEAVHFSELRRAVELLE